MDRFSVYKHQFTLPGGTLAKRQFIVIRLDDNTLTFTDFGKYITNKKAYTTPGADGGNQFHFVVQMLNYAFQTKGIEKLNDLTVDIVKDFLQCYSFGTLPADTGPRRKDTVIACSNAILNFLINYLNANENASAMKKKDLFRREIYKDKHHHTKERNVPIFETICEDIEKTILRDIPNKAFALLLNHIANMHPELLGLVILSSFAGLRPSEACNVRREDSALGPGILFHHTDGEVTQIRIDLRKELILRSDDKPVGSIKKERLQTVPAIFITSFMSYYEQYLKYIGKRSYEESFGPLTTNGQGKAMTYRSYFNAFKKIVKEEMIPIYLASDDPDVVGFGRILMEYDLAPHSLRHWYSVQLTLAGYSIPELMNARGDRSPESALTYIQNKGELEKQYAMVTDKIFDYFSWAAEVKHGI